MTASDDESRVLLLYCGGTIGMLSSSVGHIPHSSFLISNLRAQSRFHDPQQESVFAHSSSVTAFSNWSKNSVIRSASGSTTPNSTIISEGDASYMTVKSTTGTHVLPSLVTPKSSKGKRIRYAILEYDPLIDSSEVELGDWIKIATDIELNYSSFDSFIILHGTDTMAYTASALSFLLENLGKTVIITGAQIPLSELFNDSIDNLLGSLIIAGHYHIPEVSLFFNHKLLRGNRSIKASSDEFDAFASPSLAPLATVGIDIEVVWSEIQRAGLKPFTAHKAMCPDVATLRIFPGISGNSVRAFLNAGNIKGIVLETYGAGNAPRREELLSAFREAGERGVVIVNISQCATGSVMSEIYETGRILAAAGIIGGADMTVECALAKLSYLLSKPELSPAQIRKLISRPLRGELTLVSPIPTFSSPVDSGDRLRTLFAQVIECSSTGSRSGGVQRSRATSNVDSILHSDQLLPNAFDTPWPSTQGEAEVVEKAILPFLLQQAASKSGSLLSEIIASLLLTESTQSLTSTSVNHDSTLNILSEPCTLSALQTPLHIAVLSSQLENVNLLLSHGASVHSRDILSHSALFYGARLSSGSGKEIVLALKAVGAHLSTLEIERGDVGLEIARADKSGNIDAIELWKLACGENWNRAKGSLRMILE